MSLQALDKVLKRLVLDGAFRAQMRIDPAPLLDAYDLSDEERTRLMRLQRAGRDAMDDAGNESATEAPVVGAHYGIQIMLAMSYAAAVAHVTAALKDEGFGVLTEIDVQATLKQKLGVDFRPYCILGACNPPLAYRAFQSEPEIGLLMPCNVIVYAEDAERTVVSLADPLAMLGLAGNPALRELADEARRRLIRVAVALQRESIFPLRNTGEGAS